MGTHHAYIYIPLEPPQLRDTKPTPHTTMPATPVGDQPQAATNTNTLNAAAAHLAHNNGLKVVKNNVLKNQTGYNSPLFDGKDSQMEKGEY